MQQIYSSTNVSEKFENNSAFAKKIIIIMETLTKNFIKFKVTNNLIVVK